MIILKYFSNFQGIEKPLITIALFSPLFFLSSLFASISFLPLICGCWSASTRRDSLSVSLSQLYFVFHAMLVSPSQPSSLQRRRFSLWFPFSATSVVTYPSLCLFVSFRNLKLFHYASYIFRFLLSYSFPLQLFINCELF